MAKITIDVDAKIASLEANLSRAERSIEKFTNKTRSVSRDIGFLAFAEKAKLGAFAVVELAKSLVGGIDRAAKFGSELDRLGDLTGISGKNLLQLRQVLADVGIEFQAGADAIRKFSLTLSEAKADKLSEAARTFKAIGLDPNKFKDFNDALLQTVGTLGEFEAGEDRNKLAANLLGRSFETLIPLIQRSREEQAALFASAASATANKNAEQLADASEKYEESISKLKLAFDKFISSPGRISEVTGAINAVTFALETLTKVAEKARSFFSGLFDSFSNSLTGTAIDEAGVKKNIDFLIRERDRFIKNTRNGDTGYYDKLIEENQRKLSGFAQKAQEEVKKIEQASEPTQKKKAAPSVPTAPKIDNSVRDFLSKLRVSRDEVQNSVETFDRYKDALENSKEQATRFEVTLGKMGDAARRAEGLAPLTQSQKALAIELARSTDAFAEQEAKLKSLKGFDDYLENLKLEVSLINATEQERTVRLKLYELEKSKITETNEQYQSRKTILENLVRAQKDYADSLTVASVSSQLADQNAELEFQLSLIGKTELETRKLTAARQIDLAVRQSTVGADGKPLVGDATARQLEAAGEQAKAKAASITEAIFNESRSSSTGFKVFYNEYLDTISNAADGTRDLFKNAFSSLEDNLVSFVTTGKLTFGSLVQSIEAGLARIAIQQAILKPFGNFLSNGGGSGALDFISGLFGGGFAVGGTLPNNKFSLVGENGPELIARDGSGRIYTNQQSREMFAGGGAINITVNVPQSTSASTASQVAAQVGASVNRALRRNS